MENTTLKNSASKHMDAKYLIPQIKQIKKKQNRERKPEKRWQNNKRQIFSKEQKTNGRKNKNKSQRFTLKIMKLFNSITIAK